MKFVKTFALGAAAVALGGVAFAQQNTATDTASASVDVVQPIAITNVTDFALTDANATPVDTVIVGAEIDGSAVVDVSGEPAAVYNVVLSAAALSLDNGTDTFALNLDTVADQTIAGDGTSTFNVDVTDGQTVPAVSSGTYTGSVDVTVTYN